MRIVYSFLILSLLSYFLVGCSNNLDDYPTVPLDVIEINVVAENLDTSDFNLRSTGVVYKSENCYSVPFFYEALSMYETDLSYTYKVNNGETSSIQGYGPLDKTEDLRIIVPESDVKVLDLNLEFRIYTSSMGDGYHIVNVPVHFNFS